MITDERSPVLYLPHGGGPLPLLGDPGHAELIRFLREGCPALLPEPDAILVVSAHWEADVCTVQAGANPTLLYDYHGFAPEAYRLSYPAPGAPALAAAVGELLTDRGIEARLDAARGFDHGLFVPLMLMYPRAHIPCLQLSLLASMDPARHIAVGRALASLRDRGVMIIGSGSSFHNLQAFRDGEAGRERCAAFDQWLADSCCHSDIAATASRLTAWQEAPEARYAHPREEHLLPLHVCFGAALAAGQPARRVFDGEMMGYRMSAFLWS